MFSIVIKFKFISYLLHAADEHYRELPSVSVCK